MNVKVHPAIAVIAIACVLAVIGFFFWKANEDKPLRDRNSAYIVMDRSPGKPNAGKGDQPASKAGKPNASGDARTGP